MYDHLFITHPWPSFVISTSKSLTHHILFSILTNHVIPANSSDLLTNFPTFNLPPPSPFLLYVIALVTFPKCSYNCVLSQNPTMAHHCLHGGVRTPWASISPWPGFCPSLLSGPYWTAALVSQCTLRLLVSSTFLFSSYFLFSLIFVKHKPSWPLKPTSATSLLPQVCGHLFSTFL